MALGDNLIDLKAKEHFIDEIERKQRQIDDLRIAIDMNYQKLITMKMIVYKKYMIIYQIFLFKRYMK